MQRHQSAAPATGPAPPAQLTLGTAEWLLIMLHSVLWGASFFFGAVAIREIPSLTITGFRAIPASIIVVGVCLSMGLAIPLRAGYWGRMFVLGILNNIAPMLLILWAQHQVASGVAAVFNATTPLFVVVIAHFASADERFSWNKGLGLLVGIAGVSVLVGTNVTSGTTGGVLAKAALLAAAMCYALAGIFARRTSREAPFVIAAGQLLAALAMALPLALIVDRPFALPMPSAVAMGAVLGIGIFSSALASLVYFTVIKRAGATNGLLVTLLLPITPLVLGALFLGEHVSGREFAGAGIIALALVILDGRLLRRLFDRRQV